MLIRNETTSTSRSVKLLCVSNPIASKHISGCQQIIWAIITWRKSNTTFYSRPFRSLKRPNFVSFLLGTFINSIWLCAVQVSHPRAYLSVIVCLFGASTRVAVKGNANSDGNATRWESTPEFDAVLSSQKEQDRKAAQRRNIDFNFAIRSSNRLFGSNNGCEQSDDALLFLLNNKI